MARDPFHFSFERPPVYRRHQQVTMSPSDPNPDVQQDDNYATARLRKRWGSFVIGVRPLSLQNGTVNLFVYGIGAGCLRHLSLQFWDGLDFVAFIGLVLVTLAWAFSHRRGDDARYGGMHSVLWFIAACFVGGRMVAVYLNLFPSSVPSLGQSLVVAARSGTRLDDWIPFVAKAPLEWTMILVLLRSWRHTAVEQPASVDEPPSLWFDRYTPPPSPATRLPVGVFGLGMMIPIIAPTTLTRVDIVLLTTCAAGICLVLHYVIAVEMSDYGKAAVQDPDVTYPWLAIFSPRRYQIFEFLALSFLRVLAPAFAGMAAAFLLGNFWCGGAMVILAYVVTAAGLAPAGSGTLFNRLLFIFQHYPDGENQRPAPGRFEMSPLITNVSDRHALIGMTAFAAATAVYSLQTLIPTWPNVPRYWFFITDLPPMAYTGIALCIVFQGLGTAAFVKCIFVAGYGRLLQDRFSPEVQR